MLAKGENMEGITLSNLHVEGIMSGRVIDFFLETHAGKHGRARISFEISDDLKIDNLLNYQQREVKIYAESNCIFVGVITKAYFRGINKRNLVMFEVASASVKMDIKRKNRTFQAVDKTLRDIACKIAKDYSAEIMIAENIAISRMLYQYNETDWEFLKRVCDSLGIMIFCDNSSENIRISLGCFPLKYYKYNSADLMHGCCVSYMDIRRRQENTRPYSYIEEFEDVKIMTYDLLPSAGYGVMLQYREQMVFASKIIINGDALENELIIRHKEGLCPTVAIQKKKWNHPCYIRGKVIEVQGQRIKVKFDCDLYQRKEDARWIPYENTVNNYMYSMPDIGDNVYVYFEECGELFALGSHRDTLGNNPDYHTPENRNLTSENSMIQFQPECIVCVAGRDGYDSSHIIEDEQYGIEIKSSENIVVKSEQNICLDAKAGNVADNAYKLMAGFNKGYLNYLHNGGSPLQRTYLITSCGMMGKDATWLYSQSPLFEEPVKSKTVCSLESSK